MSNMFQFFEMMVVPTTFFLTCRYINRRGERTAITPNLAVCATAVDSGRNRTRRTALPCDDRPPVT